MDIISILTVVYVVLFGMAMVAVVKPGVWTEMVRGLITLFSKDETKVGE